MKKKNNLLKTPELYLIECDEGHEIGLLILSPIGSVSWLMFHESESPYWNTAYDCGSWPFPKNYFVTFIGKL